MVVDIKTVLICDAVDGACIELLEANGIKVSDKVIEWILIEITGCENCVFEYYLNKCFLFF